LKSILLFFISISFVIYAQDSTGSLAFKKNRPVRQHTIFYQPDLSYRIWQQFNLIKEANSGNPLAQHELGLRYLLGEDQAPDTTKAIFWIRKAALQKLPAAAFNYGILLYNGWGTDWNPFDAFNNFLIAANDSMPQALYIMGILHTDNLIVKRDWAKAYHYTKLAANKGNKPAADILPLIRKHLPENFDTTKTISSSSTLQVNNSTGLVFIDFDRPASDPTAEISDSLLFEDLLFAGSKFDSIVVLKDNKTELRFNEKDLPLLNETADWGAPEAAALLGRLYEKGFYYPKNLITAAAYYLRSAKMDSYRSTILLYQLVKDDNFISIMKEAAIKEDAEAMFVWYGLYNFNLDNSITEKDAVNLLVKSAEKNYLPALVELGLNLYTGKYFNKDITRALAAWKQASSKGYKEADIRLAASVIYNESEGDIDHAIRTVIKGTEQGSVLAQVTAGYAYENTLIANSKKGDEIQYYRTAAQRGNRFAVSQLERRYNEIRPIDPKFQLN
jgi:uncharacterized protein